MCCGRDSMVDIIIAIGVVNVIHHCLCVSGLRVHFFVLSKLYVYKRLGLKFGNMSLLKSNVGSNMFENVVRHCSGLKIGSVSPLRPYVGSSTH